MLRIFARKTLKRNYITSKAIDASLAVPIYERMIVIGYEVATAASGCTSLSATERASPFLLT